MRYRMYQFKEQDAYDFANHVGARTQKKAMNCSLGFARTVKAVVAETTKAHFP